MKSNLKCDIITSTVFWEQENGTVILLGVWWEQYPSTGIGSFAAIDTSIAMSVRADRKEYTVEAVITASPHAFDPIAHYNLPPEEQEKVYSRRVNELVRPYTVIDVLTKVYHRSFSNDLAEYIGKHPEAFARYKKTDGSWGMARVWVNECQCIRPESVFDQPKECCCVDIVISARVKVEEEKYSVAHLKSHYTIKGEFRLRYVFNFRPCHLTCVFDRVIVDEKDSLLAIFPDAIKMDKYLLPLLLTIEDYKKAAALVIRQMRTALKKKYRVHVPFDPRKWICIMGPKILLGAFPENGAMGEYFFDFGQADLFDAYTGEVSPDSNINPGTIILNYRVLQSKAIENSTICHEGCHHRFNFYYLMLQKTHGHSYASYLCKRFDKTDKQGDSKWSPIDIMELHANKLPGYIMIQDKPGKAYADKLMKSYGGEHTLQNLEQLVKDVAAHFEVPISMARRRLTELGYPDVDGISQYVNNVRVPNHLSKLPPKQTYTIDEQDAIAEYLRNPEFRRVLDTGLFIFAENHYCLNTSQYVYVDHGGYFHLTREARENMSACCLVFEEKYLHKLQVLLGGRLLKSPGKGSKCVQYRGKNGEAVTTAEGLALRKMVEKQAREMQVVRKTFNQMTVDLMKKHRFTVPSLAEATGMSPDTIKNLRNDPDRVFDIRELVAFCIALHLPPDVSDEYINASLSKFRNSIDMELYKYALKQWYTLPVPVVNRKLVEAGAVPLTNYVDGYDENGIRIDA